MKYLIKNCKVIHEGSKLHGKKVDILLERGVISKIGKKLTDDKAKVIQGKQLHASIGWMDIGTHLGEPGYEHRETMETLSAAALAGGYTDLVTMPKSIPVVQSKAQIKNLILTGQNYGINIHPLGALSNDLKGENITEFVDMNQAGAVGFTDGLNPVSKGGLLLRALQYSKQFNGIVFHHPSDESLSNNDLIHEGDISIQLGMKGSPSLAEELITYRDVQLNQYAESKLAVHLISSSESVDIIKSAKKKDINLKSGVSYLNLIKNHEDLQNFNSNLKVKPILRSKKDQRTLKRGLKDGTIDYISSNHVPLELELKHLEYPYASHGAIGLETCFAALCSSISKDIPLPLLIEKLTIGPRSTIGLPINNIEEGQPVNLTIFDPTVSWAYSASQRKSLSSNSPFLETKFTGKVIAAFNGKHAFIS